MQKVVLAVILVSLAARSDKYVLSENSYGVYDGCTYSNIGGKTSKKPQTGDKVSYLGETATTESALGPEYIKSSPSAIECLSKGALSSFPVKGGNLSIAIRNLPMGSTFKHFKEIQSRNLNPAELTELLKQVKGIPKKFTGEGSVPTALELKPTSSDTLVLITLKGPNSQKDRDHCDITFWNQKLMGVDINSLDSTIDGFVKLKDDSLKFLISYSSSECSNVAICTPFRAVQKKDCEFLYYSCYH